MHRKESDPLVAFRDDDSHPTTTSRRPTPERNVIVVIISIMIVLAAFSGAFFVVAPGTVGIVVTLGKVISYPSGLHFKIPFVSQLIEMNAKTQKLEESNDTPTKEGLTVRLDTAVLFRLEPEKAADVYRQVGEDYVNLLLAPEAASAIRGMTSELAAKALYSSGRNLIQDTLRSELKTKLEPRGITIEDVLLKDIKLPTQLSQSIELKAQAEQDAARMQFVLQKEKQEAQRKSIEAQGIADFQTIVSKGISHELLQWKGVEATEKFANSPNTKIIIMGNGPEGLPVILSAESSSSS